MTVYLGTLGRMVKLWSTPSAQVQAEDRYSFTTTLEGSRKAQVRRNGRRTWSLNAAFADPSESAALQQFASGAWGNGPFVFVSADAPMTNMLTPDGANCKVIATTGNQLAGPVLCSDGTWSPASILVGSGPYIGFQLEPFPVIGGSLVTASAEVLGDGGKVGVSFYNASGVFVSRVDSPAMGVAGVARRASLSVLVPTAAVSAQIISPGSVQATRPQLTWTDSPMPWSDGQGCAKAVVHEVTRDLVLAAQGHTFSNVAFTVSEVG